MNNQLDPLAHAKDTLLDLAIRFGPKILVAVLIMAAGFIVAGWAARATARGLDRLDLEPPVRQLLTRVSRVAVVALFAIMALQNLGVELLPLLAGLGVAGAGIALATQGVLSNMVAGLTIIFTKPYRIGEYIAIAGVEGQVEAITLFNTALTHLDRSRIVVPIARWSVRSCTTTAESVSRTSVWGLPMRRISPLLWAPFVNWYNPIRVFSRIRRPSFR